MSIKGLGTNADILMRGAFIRKPVDPCQQPAWPGLGVPWATPGNRTRLAGRASWPVNLLRLSPTNLGKRSARPPHRWREALVFAG